jgi:hypothetical protein
MMSEGIHEELVTMHFNAPALRLQVRAATCPIGQVDLACVTTLKSDSRPRTCPASSKVSFFNAVSSPVNAAS